MILMYILYWLMLALIKPVCMVLLSLVLTLAAHELGHAYMCWYCDVKIKGFTIGRKPFRFGIVREPSNVVHNLLIAAGGPLFNLVFAVCFFPVSHTFALFNLVLGLASLLPTRYSDGEHILECVNIIKQSTV